MSNDSNRTTTRPGPQTNSTTDNDDAQYYLFITQIICYCAISIVGTLANVVICVGLSRGRRKSSEYFVLNLAIADLLVCAIGIPLDIYLQYADSWPYGDFLCHVIYPSQTLLILISILTLMGMSLERHRAICSPLKQRLSSKRFKFSIVFIWLIAIAAVIPYAKALKYSDEQCDENWSVPDNAKYYTLALFIIDYCIPLTIITYCYTRAGYVLNRKFKKFSGRGTTSVKQNIATMKRLQQNKKVIKIFSSAVILFVICVLPGDCYWMWFSFRSAQYHPYDNHLQAFSTILLYANSAINPFIFGACQMVCYRKMQPRFSDQLTSSTGLSRSRGSGSSNGTGEGLNRSSFSRTAVRKHVKYTSLSTKNDLHNTKDDTKHPLDNTEQGLRETRQRFRDTNQELCDTNKEMRDTNKEIGDTEQAQRVMNRELSDIRSISSDSSATLSRDGEDDAFSVTCDISETLGPTESMNFPSYNTFDDENAREDFSTNTEPLSPNTIDSTKWANHEINVSTIVGAREEDNTTNELQNTKTEQRILEPADCQNTNETCSEQVNEIPHALCELLQCNSMRETDL